MSYHATFRKFKKHFETLKKDPITIYKKQLLTIKEHSKSIPAPVLMDINNQLAKLIDENPAPPLINKVANHYNVNTVQGDFIINNNQEPAKRKQKSRDIEEECDSSFYQTWKSFLDDAESNRNLHKYSPEKNGVLRFAHKLQARPSMSNINNELKGFIDSLTINASTSLEENIEDTINLKEYKPECRFIKKIFTVMLTVNKKLPPMTYSEAVFNHSLAHPCLPATATFLQEATPLGPYFTPGEEPLQAMIEQLTIMDSKVDKRKTYNADGVIRLHELYDLEILLLETAGSFQSKDERKISFDNIKGMFALFAMMKTVADRFDYASVELFKKLKLYFVQASDEYLRLWSIQYISNGTYKFNGEDKIVVVEDRSHVEQMLPSLLDFFYLVKTSLAKTCGLLQQLKHQHEQNIDSNSQQTLLSDIICPKVFRLTYNRHGKGFARQSVISSPESGSQ